MYIVNPETKADLIALQKCFKSQIVVLEKITALDTSLKELSSKKWPSLKKIKKVLNDKDELLQQLNQLMDECNMRFSSIKYYISSDSCKSDPHYIKLKEYMRKTQFLMSQVCEKEDFDIYHITRNLSSFRKLLCSL